MGGPKIITYKKQYGMGGDKDNNPSLQVLKNQAVEKLLTYPPILGRFFVDRLINVVDEKELKWNLELIDSLDMAEIHSICNVLDNRMEMEKKTY